MKGKSILLFTLLIFTFYSCYRTRNNRFVIVGAELIIYDLQIIPDSNEYIPEMDLQLIGQENLPLETEICLGLLMLNKEFISDESDSCDVPFDGKHGKMDSILFFTSSQDSLFNKKSVKIRIDGINEINDIYSKLTGKYVDKAPVHGFQYVDHFFDFESIKYAYNNPNAEIKVFNNNRNIAFPVLLNKSTIEILELSPITLKTDQRIIQVTVKRQLTPHKK